MEGGDGSLTAPIRVLHVEDDESVRLMVETLLDQEGMEVHSLKNLYDGVVNAAEGPPDVAILDLNTGDSSGSETVTWFRTMHPECPVIVLTGSPEDVAAEVLAKGASGFLTKDQLVGDKLAHLVRDVVGRHG